MCVSSEPVTFTPAFFQSTLKSHYHKTVSQKPKQKCRVFMWHSSLFTAIEFKLWVAEEKENRLKGHGFLDQLIQATRQETLHK